MPELSDTFKPSDRRGVHLNMSINSIQEAKLLHISAVANLMYERAFEMTGDEKYAEEMYVLGFVHDIGYIFGAKGHAEAGGDLMTRVGFKYADAVSLHGEGDLDPDRLTQEVMLIQWCDMSVGPGGVRMSVAERLEDIGVRYGTDSKQYREAAKVAARLNENGMF